VQDALLKQTNVDDICTGVDSEEEALNLQETIISMMAGAGFELKKLSSNIRSVLDCVVPEDRATGSTSFDGNEESGVKVLGLQWTTTKTDSTTHFNSNPSFRQNVGCSL